MWCNKSFFFESYIVLLCELAKFSAKLFLKTSRFGIHTNTMSCEYNKLAPIPFILVIPLSFVQYPVFDPTFPLWVPLAIRTSRKSFCNFSEHGFVHTNRSCFLKNEKIKINYYFLRQTIVNTSHIRCKYDVVHVRYIFCGTSRVCSLNSFEPITGWIFSLDIGYFRYTACLKK